MKAGRKILEKKGLTVALIIIVLFQIFMIMWRFQSDFLRYMIEILQEILL